MQLVKVVCWIKGHDILTQENYVRGKVQKRVLVCLRCGDVWR